MKRQVIDTLIAITCVVVFSIVLQFVDYLASPELAIAGQFDLVNIAETAGIIVLLFSGVNTITDVDSHSWHGRLVEKLSLSVGFAENISIDNQKGVSPIRDKHWLIAVAIACFGFLFYPDLAMAAGDGGHVVASETSGYPLVVLAASAVSALLPTKYIPIVGPIVDIVSFAVGKGKNSWF